MFGENIPSLFTEDFQIFSQQLDRSALLFRQYIKYSLYDRMSTRPFLSTIEKRWIAFQLLCALNQCHKVKVSKFTSCSIWVRMMWDYLLLVQYYKCWYLNLKSGNFLNLVQISSLIYLTMQTLVFVLASIIKLHHLWAFCGLYIIVL